MPTIAATIADRMRLTSTGSTVKAHAAEVAELMIVSPQARQRWRLHATLRSVLSLKSVPHVGAVLAITLRAAVGVRSSFRFGYVLTLRAGLQVVQRQVVRQGLVLRERLRVKPVGAVTAVYKRTSTHRFRLTDRALLPYLGALLRSTFTVAAEAVGIRRAVATALDHLELRDVLAQKLTITLVSHDAVLIHDATLLTSIFSGTLADAVDFIVDTVSPAGDTTTWAMNVRTGAVTEYLNYSFNSFARSASGTYLGAGDDGLFELAGPDDAGEPVIADIISGLVDFSGSFLSGMQAAYLAVRGNGEFFLKLTEATGRSTTYQVKATSMRTSRVNVGKGLRARYFTYELTSTGQDFDLLDLTFLPIQQTRRI